MPRSRKLWTPKPKPKAKAKATAKLARQVWASEREKPKPAPATSPNKSKPAKKTPRVLADLSKIQPARLEHGWRFEDTESQRRKRKVMVGERWTCDYAQADGTPGCKSFVWQHQPAPGQFHSWDCPYWHLEGKDLTPF